MIDILYKMFACIVYFLISLLFCQLLTELICVLFDLRPNKFFKKIKDKLTQSNDAYKDFVRTTNSYGRVVELPFSVVQPLLRDDSPMILIAQSDRLAIKDENCRNGIYIKLSKKDYNEYIKFLEQKKVNKQNLKKTEDTLAATQLINKELKRINDEAIKSVKKETENLNKFTEMYRQIRTEEEAENLNNLAKLCKYIRTEELLFDEKPIEKPEKFDQELFDKIWNGQAVIIMRNEYELGVFNACRFDRVLRDRETLPPVTKPLVARYYHMDNQWVVNIATQYSIDRGVTIMDLSSRCPNFTEKFKQKINTKRMML